MFTVFVALPMGWSGLPMLLFFWLAPHTTGGAVVSVWAQTMLNRMLQGTHMSSEAALFGVAAGAQVLPGGVCSTRHVLGWCHPLPGTNVPSSEVIDARVPLEAIFHRDSGASETASALVSTRSDPAACTA